MYCMSLRQVLEILGLSYTVGQLYTSHNEFPCKLSILVSLCQGLCPQWTGIWLWRTCLPGTPLHEQIHHCTHRYNITWIRSMHEDTCTHEEVWIHHAQTQAQAAGCNSVSPFLANGIFRLLLFLLYPSHSFLFYDSPHIWNNIWKINCIVRERHNFNWILYKEDTELLPALEWLVCNFSVLSTIL